MKQANIWITGANGFTGTYLTRYLKNYYIDSNIIAIDIAPSESKFIDKYFVMNIANPGDVSMLAKKHPPSYVYHLAGALPPAPWETMWNVNIGKALGFKIIIARTFNLIGPGMSKNLVVGEICSQIAQGKNQIKLGNIESKRDFIDVRDVVKAYCSLIDKAEHNTIYNVCSGIPTSIKDVVEIASTVTGRNLVIEKDISKIRDIEHNNSYGDNKNILRNIEWKITISLEDSIQDIISCFINSK